MAALCGRSSDLPGSWFPGLADPHIAATHHLQVMRVAPKNNQEFCHDQTNTNPPDTDPASPYESLDSKKFHEAAERALDHYLNPAAHIMASTNEPEPMFFANPKYDTESLLANASESLGSATTMLSNFAALLENSHRKTLLGITQVVMLGELAVNQALDKVELKE